MLKITRRPYQECAYRWALSTSGISVGEGECSYAQCAELNGDFELDFSACASRHGKLVWAGDCEHSLEPHEPCVDCPDDIEFDLPAISDGNLFSCSGNTPTGTVVNEFPASTFSMYRTASICHNLRKALSFGRCNVCGLTGYQFEVLAQIFPGDVATLTTLPCPSAPRPAFVLSLYWGQCDQGSITNTDGSSPIVHYTAYYYSDDMDCGAKAFTKVCQVSGDARGDADDVNWPDTIITRGVPFSGGTTGPKPNDRIRSKWHLEYDIEATLWTLRSFNRIDYPIYTLLDASPCDGDTKTLLLADKGDAADGCGVAPAEMTITRVCPPDRVGKSALLEDRKPNGATGKRKRQCGCDCLDEVDDRRQCATKCTSTEDEGCGNINPAPDDITCRFPEAINCCEHTAGMDVPCAYTVEFECDLFYDIESVRHNIAAKQVTLRRECYFEDPCRFVAAGAESSTGGSPVMDVDGFPGAQPVCASCADDCLTGCTWSAWTVAECPEPPLPCGPNMCDTTTTFTMDIPVTIGTGDVPCTSAHSVTLLHTVTDDRWTVDGMSFPSSSPPAGQIEIAMELHENCVTLSLYRTADCGSFGPVIAAYSGTPESGDCPAEFVFTRDFGSSSAFPSTLTATRV